MRRVGALGSKDLYSYWKEKVTERLIEDGQEATPPGTSRSRRGSGHDPDSAFLVVNVASQEVSARWRAYAVDLRAPTLTERAPVCRVHVVMHENPPIMMHEHISSCRGACMRLSRPMVTSMETCTRPGLGRPPC